VIRVLPGGWRAERLAGTTFVLMIALTAIGWCTAPGDHTAAPASPGSYGLPYQFTATAVPTDGLTTATALILGVLILGAAAIGIVFLRPGTGRAAATPRRGASAAPCLHRAVEYLETYFSDRRMAARRHRKTGPCLGRTPSLMCC
jgi:hypothetical protein